VEIQQTQRAIAGMSNKIEHRLPPLPPKFLVLGLQRFRSFLMALHSRLFPSQLIVYETFQNLYLLPALYVAAELNLASLIIKGETHIEPLAKKCHVDPEGLYRVMRALTGLGIFREKPDQHFLLTKRGKVLLDSHPSSLRHVLRHHLSPTNWHMQGSLLETLKTGEDGFTRIYGKSSYEYLKDNPDQFAIFDLSMSELTAMGLPAILKAYPFKQHQFIADIGGGDGTLLAHILSQNPKAKGVLLDVPEALAKSKDLFESMGISNRIKLQEGDFMKEIPEGCDLYLLKNVLHNWSDPDAVKILKNIASVMPEKSRIIIIEMAIPENNRLSTAKLIDIQMLTAMKGGKERTIRGYEKLCHEAGLVIKKIHTTIAPIVLLEVKQPSNE
jgi:ubiquinone/menaquinone biosynthesis C-methylase UbiE